MSLELKKFKEGESVKYLDTTEHGELGYCFKAENEDGEIIYIINTVIPKELQSVGKWIRWDGEEFVLAVCPNS